MTTGLAPDSTVDLLVDPEADAPDVQAEDARVDARLFTDKEVRRAARRISPAAALFICVAAVAGLATGFSVAAVPSTAPPDYHGVSAGGLMALAGIVPAVLAAVATGRPVTRLDGGRIMLRGLSQWIVALYGLAWLGAFLVPLFSLVAPWPWLGSPAGIGTGLGLLVFTTLMTPALFFVLAGRLHPRQSTLLAVARASRRAGDDPKADDVRRRCALVKDLRDLARSEFQAGDRRAVRYRMAGLATIAARTDIPDVIELALDELGLVCQDVVLDRDLAREGIAVFFEAARTLPPTDLALHRRAVRELVGVWSSAVRRGGSGTLRDEVVDVVVHVAGLRGDEALPLLAHLLAEFQETTGLSREKAIEAMRSIEARVDFVRLPTGLAASDWARARGRLDAGGFPLLLARYTDLTASGRVPDSAKALASAAAWLAVSDVRNHRLRSKVLLSTVTAAPGSDRFRAVLRAATAALWLDHPAAEASRGVMLAEVVRTVPQMSPPELDELVTAITPLPDDVLLDRCAAALLPALESLVAPLLRPADEGEDPKLHARRQGTLVLLVTDLRTAAAMRDARLADPIGTGIEQVLARLVEGVRTGSVVGEPSEMLRRRTAALVHRVAEVDGHGARTVAASALPLLLTARGVFGASWLLWWQEGSDGRLREQVPGEWTGRLVTALLALRSTADAAEPDAPLGLPAGDPHESRGWTWDMATDAANAVLPDLLTGLTAAELATLLPALHRWVNQPTGDDETSQGTATHAAAALGFLPVVDDDDPRATLLACHRTALELSLHGLWWLPGTVDVPDPARTTIAAEILSTATPKLLRAGDNLALQVLEALVRTWWSGITAGGHPVEPATLAAVRQVALARLPVRGFLETRLDDPAVPAEVRHSLRGLPGRARSGGTAAHGDRGPAHRRPGAPPAGRGRHDRPPSADVPRQRRPHAPGTAAGTSGGHPEPESTTGPAGDA
jgi:hypothetical protein